MLKINLKSMLLAAVFGLLATPALAQEVPEHGVYILNSLLFLMAGFLVMLWPRVFVCWKLASSAPRTQPCS